MRRGDVFVAELRPRSGSEQTGSRPVLVISHDGFNHTPSWRSIIVVPFSTSTNQGRRGPTAIPVPADEGGLTRDSIAICHQVTTLDRTKLKTHLGTLSTERVAEIELGLKAAMGMSE